MQLAPGRLAGSIAIGTAIDHCGGRPCTGLVLLPPHLLLVGIVLLLLLLARLVVIVLDELVEVVLLLRAYVFEREGIAEGHAQVRLVVDVH